MKLKMSRAGLLFAAVLAAGAPVAAADSGVPSATGAGAGEAQILSRIRPPSFPARCFAITDFGARSGADASAAISAAIAACAKAGGGHVVVPAGQWGTGPVRLLGGVDLHLERGAVLRFSTNPADYPNVRTRFEGVECMNFQPLIYAEGQSDIAVSGEGLLDGQASPANWWAWHSGQKGPDREDRMALFQMGEEGVPVERRVFGGSHRLRPSFIEFTRCRNILIEGVAIIRSPMWEIHPVLCQNVTVRGVRISSLGPNNDGCDPECSRDVLIQDCLFNTGDDCIAIKSGRNNDGRRVGVPVENIIVRGCVMRDGHGGVSIGSEISGGCRNVFVEGCLMDSPRLNYGLRLKSNGKRGGFMENVQMRNTGIGTVSGAALIVDMLYSEVDGFQGPFPPVVRNVRLENVASAHSRTVFKLATFPAATVEGVRVEDSVFRGVAKDSLQAAPPLALSHVLVNPPDPAPIPHPDAVVAQDGTGQYSSVQDAVSAAPVREREDGPRWVILVKPGIYREHVYVQRERGNILLEGEDPSRTFISGSLHASLPGPDGRPIGTFRTATVQVDADGFAALNISFVNESGPVGQAVALRVDGDRVEFRNCRILGWQDSLLVNRGRQVFRDCLVEGTVDFIFGGATAFFDHCRIHCLGDGYVTAASTPQGAGHGLVFSDCRITAEDGVRTFLGRPWRTHAQVAFLRTEMAGAVRPEGWNDWKKPEAHQSARFAEYASSGPGAAGPRAGWSHELSEAEARSLDENSVVGGPDGWKPSL
jgi:polygalacturonase/pectin methylesterase-like acyl-CoA thioesterase